MTRAQLQAPRVRPRADARRSDGRLAPVHRGVYAVGPLSDRGRQGGGARHGPHSAASFSTATALHALVPPARRAPRLAHPGDRRAAPRPVDPPRTRTRRRDPHRGNPGDDAAATLADLGWPDRLVREALARDLVRPEQLPDARRATRTDNDFEDRMRALRREGRPVPSRMARSIRFGPLQARPRVARAKVMRRDRRLGHARRRPAAFEDDRARTRRCWPPAGGCCA